MGISNKILNSAIKYRSQNWSVIPLCAPNTDGKCRYHSDCNSPGKRSILSSWKDYQNRIATEDEIRFWWKKYPEANIGIVTGRISEIVVIDVEKEGDMSYPPTVIATTGGGGKHFFYAHPGGTIPNSTRIKKLTDIRGDGGLIVAAPSRHKSGGVYEWLISLDDASLAPFPTHLFPTLKERKNLEEIIVGVSQGDRNNSAAVVIGSLLAKHPGAEWETICWQLVRGWNTQNNPPINNNELRKTFDSVAALESSKEKKSAPAIWKSATTFEDLLAAEYPPLVYVIDRLIPSDGIFVLSSPPGQFKSYIAAHFAVACTTGTKALGYFASQKVNVMIVDEENAKRRNKTRMESLTQEKQLPISYHIKEGIKISDDVTLAKLLEEASQLNIGLIIFDTLVRIHDGDENNATEMNHVYEKFKQFSERGIAVLIIHHHKKQGRENRISVSDPVAAGEALRGSGDILGMADSHLAILGMRTDDKGKYLIAMQTKQRDDELLEPFIIRIKNEKETGMMSFVYDGKYVQEQTAVEDAKEKILAFFESKGGWSSKKDIENSLKEVKESSRNKALKALTNSFCIEEKTKKELKAMGLEIGAEIHSKTLFYRIAQPNPLFDDPAPF